MGRWRDGCGGGVFFHLCKGIFDGCSPVEEEGGRVEGGGRRKTKDCIEWSGVENSILRG
jgi:hypothetical protein